MAYEAAVAGEKAHIFKARYLHGSGGRKCGGHKCEGRASYPGRSVVLPLCYRRREVPGWGDRSQPRP
ncbi:MAG: hypothetical protein CL549_10965 [Alcanivorax sp.]|nr:hypothetical protein [Alcanivorax sp.]MAY10997.1 hypothetical protein [Alcanivorax sp.]MBI54076.1 hypothetical protein [Alcanivorax sp.]